MEVETKNIFSVESSGTSSIEATNSSLLSRANRLLTQLKSDPSALTERHTKKRKRGKAVKLCRDYQSRIESFTLSHSSRL